MQALLSVRSRLFLTYRLPVRLCQLVTSDGGARTGPWRALLALFVVVDLATWWALRDPGRYGLRTRLFVDSIDMAVWSLAPYSPPNRYALAVFIGTPLAIEAGVRTPRTAVAVPAAGLAATSLARFAAHRPFLPLASTWLVLAAFCGLLLSGYDKRLRREAEHDWAGRRAAADRRAYLAGQNAVAMGASSVVDGLEGIVPILGRPEPGSALWRLSDGWKAELGDSTRREGAALRAAYLADALKEWELAHNAHPDLSARVVLTLGEGVGTGILTGTQMGSLWDLMEASGVRGAVFVDVEDPAGGEPGRTVRLRVGPQRIVVPPDRRRPVRPYDLGPATFVAVAFLALGDVVQMGVPVAVASASMGLLLGAAAWADGQLRRHGHAARPAVLAAATLAGLTMASTFALTAGQTTSPSGASFYPVIPALDLLAILAGGYRPTVGKRDLWWVAAGALGVVGGAWLLHPGSRRTVDLLIDLCWPACALATAWKFGPALARAVALHAQDFELHDDTADAAAFRSGEGHVIELVSLATDDAKDQLRSRRVSLAPELYQTVLERLEEVERRLSRLRAGQESSWSTTTG